MKKGDGYIVVTGAAGFIGSGVLRYLNDRGIMDLVVVDRLDESERWRNLVGKQFSEILDRDELLPWLQERPDEIRAILHLGACSSTVERDARFLLDNNYRYTQRLAQFALGHDIRFIYASSAATYGSGVHGFSDDHELLRTLTPLNMYGYSKHLFDLWALNEGVLDKLVGLKYFNVFGPNEFHKGRMASAVTHFLPQVVNDGVVRLFQSSEPHRYGDGEQCRDFIYVKDAVRITCAFLYNRLGGIFNVGSGRPETWKALATGVFDALGKTPCIDFIPMPEDLLGKYQNYTCAEMGKTKRALGAVADSQALGPCVGEYVRDYLVPGETW